MSPRPIDRLLVPKSIALVGGTWTDAVAKSCQTIGFDGPVWRIHPTRQSTPDTHYYRSIDELPAAPDATFLAAPNRDVPEVAAALNRRGAGGFVCFAAGFSETATDEGERLTQALSDAAGDLPFFGPNCYGFINFFNFVFVISEVERNCLAELLPNHQDTLFLGRDGISHLIRPLQ